MTISIEEFRAVSAEAERYRRERDYWKAWAKATAERQREACAERLQRTRLGTRVKVVTAVQILTATPLVTEGDK